MSIVQNFKEKVPRDKDACDDRLSLEGGNKGTHWSLRVGLVTKTTRHGNSHYYGRQDAE